MDKFKVDNLDNYHYNLSIDYKDSASLKYTDIINRIEDCINFITTKVHNLDHNIMMRKGGANNKYKKTENKITVIYKKKEYTRVIYICERKKYIKLNKTYILLSKFKKI